MTSPTDCPCGTGRPYDACCGPRHSGARPAATAEQLMRSRYAAFAVGDEAYLLATWHPSTRPRRVQHDPDTTWTGLEILATTAGSPFDTAGTVEFRAHYTTRRGRRSTAGTLQEVSQFVLGPDGWLYVAGALGTR